MADFFAMISNFGTAPRANANMDVSVDTRTAGGSPVDILFNVFAVDGTQLAEFTVTTNANGFASTTSAPQPNKNLFKISTNAPALVRARTPQIADTTTAVLHQKGAGTHLVVGVPPAKKSDGTALGQGTFFPIALGDVTKATLLIANVSGSDVVADVFLGTKGAAGSGKYSNPGLKNNCVWQLDLAATDNNANLVVCSTDAIVVQLMIDDGHINGITCVPA